jgi:hypothetical protein
MDTLVEKLNLLPSAGTAAMGYSSSMDRSETAGSSVAWTLGMFAREQKMWIDSIASENWQACNFGHSPQLGHGGT